MKLVYNFIFCLKFKFTANQGGAFLECLVDLLVCLSMLQHKHKMCVSAWRHDIQHDDTPFNDTQHNNDQNIVLNCDT